MNPVNFSESNITFKSPDGWDEEINGPCADLPALVKDGTISSVWKPSAEELAVLVAGGGVVLTITSRAQPPVRLWATPIGEPEEVESITIEPDGEVYEAHDEPHSEVVDPRNETRPLTEDEEHETIADVAARNSAREQ